jgi:AcrR family transcriptional regulator
MRVRTAVKKEEIVSSAAEVFREFGFERASMSQIAARVGGSKATLYGYFTSKEELFLAVTHAETTAYFSPVVDELTSSDDDMATALKRFGVKALAYVLRPEAIAGRRMVLAVAGQSQIAQSFYLDGPSKGLGFIKSYFVKSIASGALKHGDPWVMAQQLLALLEAELIPERLYGIETGLPSESVLHAVVGRAVDVFLAAYRP